MLIAQAEAEFILTPFKAPLYECISSAWNDYCALLKHIPYVVSPRTRACLVFDSIKSHAYSKFASRDDAKVVEADGIFVLIIQGKLNIRFKKLNYEKKPSNILTDQTKKFMRQEAWSDFLESTTNLIAGYELNKDETRLTEVTITCPKSENNNAWYFNIGDEDGQSAKQNPIQLPLTSSNDLPIRPRYVEIVKSERENE